MSESSKSADEVNGQTNGATAVDTVQAEQIARQRDEAKASVKADILAWAIGQVDQQEATLALSWDIIHLAVLGEPRQVRVVVAEAISEAKKINKLKASLSKAAVYRRIGLLLRIIKQIAGLIKPVTIPFLKKHPEHLLRVPRSALKDIAMNHPTSHALGKAFPKPAKPAPQKPGESLPKSAAAPIKPIVISSAKPELPPVTEGTIMDYIARTHTDLAILGKMLADARRRQVSFGTPSLATMKFFQRAAALAARECTKIVKLHKKDEQGTLPL